MVAAGIGASLHAVQTGGTPRAPGAPPLRCRSARFSGFSTAPKPWVSLKWHQPSRCHFPSSHSCPGPHRVSMKLFRKQRPPALGPTLPRHRTKLQSPSQVTTHSCPTRLAVFGETSPLTAVLGPLQCSRVGMETCHVCHSSV